jgi:N-acetylmuramoyl-L-alanine amidase
LPSDGGYHERVRSLAVLLLLIGATWASAKVIVCIDPGHPSEVGRGTQGKNLTELHLNWVIATQLKARLEKAGVKVVMTKKTEGEFVQNRKRAEIANAARADFLVRLHCDAANGSGFATYYPTKQGKSGSSKGPSKAVLDKSAKLAPIFHETLVKHLEGKLVDNGLMSDDRTAVGRKQGALTGSIFSKVPVVLVEMCVLTNPRDEELMASKEGQAAVADALAKATLAALKR